MGIDPGLQAWLLVAALIFVILMVAKNSSRMADAAIRFMGVVFGLGDDD